MRRLPQNLARALDPWVTRLGLLACAATLFLITYHAALALIFHRSPA